MEIRRWDVLLVNLDPTVGREIKKTRPAIVISPDEINANWSPIVIVPLTSKVRKLGFRTNVSFQGIPGQAAIDQIKAMDRTRILEKLGALQVTDSTRLSSNLSLFFR